MKILPLPMKKVGIWGIACSRSYSHLRHWETRCSHWNTSFHARLVSLLAGARLRCISFSQGLGHIPWNGHQPVEHPLSLGAESRSSTFHWPSDWILARLSWRAIEVNCANEYDLIHRLPLHDFFLPLECAQESCYGCRCRTSSVFWK